MSETFTFIDVVNEAIDSKLFDLHTSIPAIVQSFDAAKKTVNVIPALKRKDNEGNIIELPILSDVPIIFPQSNDAIFAFPLVKNDNVLLLFSERSLDSWKRDGGILDPADVRRHNISDCFAIPAPFPLSKGIAASATDMIIKFKNATIRIDSDSKVAIGNTAQELLTIVDDFLGEMANILTNTMIGPQPPINLAAFAAIKVRLGALKI